MCKSRNNMRRRHLSACAACTVGVGCVFLFLALPVCVQAQDMVEAAASDAVVAAAVEQALDEDSAVATNALSGQAPETSVAEPEKTFRRDPFWPVGYVPPTPGRPSTHDKKPAERDATEKEWDDAVNSLVYQGALSSAGAVYAIINGKMCQAGEVLTVKRGAKSFRFRIKSLASGKAQLERLREPPAAPASGI